MTKHRFRLTWPTTFAILSVFATAFLITLSNLCQSADTNAVSTANFRAGYIMSDYVMSNYTSMTESEIQAFLDSKKSCNHAISREASYMHDMGNDTWGYTNSNGNTLTFHVLNGYAVCLADERFGDGIAIGSGDTAAHIIWQTAQDYHINPQVLLVLLEKEQGLLTDDIPNNYQYRAATGYGCPDTAPCNEAYYGFKNQVRKAASLFRTVLDGGWTNYPVGNNYIKYNPSAECGGSMVYVENLATSALYRYTPYQPNAGALQAGYGTSYCGAYGNRNFYLYFYDWFGDPTSSDTITEFYRNNGGEAVFGASTSEKVCYLNKGGCSQAFVSGVITWTKNTGSHFIPNDIYTKWSADGADNNPLGYPTSNLIENPDYSYQQFETGRIYKFADGIISMSNTVFATWSKLGSEHSILGLPTSNLTNSSEGKAYQSFQTGVIYSDGTYKVVDQDIFPSDVISNGTYVFHSKINDKFVLDISGGSTANGANLQLYESNGTAAQQFAVRYYAVGDYYTIMNINSNKYLDLLYESAINSNNIQQFVDNYVCASRFKITKDNDGYYTLFSTCGNNFVIDINGGVAANGRNAQIYQSNNSAAQKFRGELIELYTIPESAPVENHSENPTPSEDPAPETPNTTQGVVSEGIYTIFSKVKSNLVWDIYNASQDDNANLWLYEPNNTDAQKFILDYDATTDSYSIINIYSNKYISTSNNAVPRSNVNQLSANNSCNQKWKLVDNPSGSFTFVSLCDSTAVIDADQSSVLIQHPNVQVYTKWGTNNLSQEWVLTKISDWSDPSEPIAPSVNPTPSEDPIPSENPTPSEDPVTPPAPVSQGVLDNGIYIFHSQINDNFVLDVSNASVSNGANIQIYELNGTNAQKFTINYYAASDDYTIMNVNSNKYLDLANSSVFNSNNIRQYDDTNTCSTHFKITKDSIDNNFYTFKSSCNNDFVIDVYSGAVFNGNNIQIFELNNTASQKFRAEKL